MGNIMFSDSSDPAMRYEGLARKVFNNCVKYGDPWGYAAQDFFTNFIPTPNTEAKKALSTIIHKIIFDSFTNREIINRLIKIEKQIWIEISQENAIKIIDKLIVIVEKEYEN